MDNIDEKISKLIMQQRNEKVKKSNEEYKADGQSNEEKMNILQEVIKQIANGHLDLNNNTFTFRKNIYLAGKLEIPIPLNYFVEQINKEDNIALVNDIHGVSFSATYIDKDVKKQKFSEFKEGMIQGFKAMKIHAEWIDEGDFGVEEYEKVYYATYKTPTAKGELYNFLFYRQYKGTMIIGNYNCFFKEIETWEPIIKASALLMTIK